MESADRVFVHDAAATPTDLLEAACERRDLERVQLYPFIRTAPRRSQSLPLPDYQHSNSLFIGSLLRHAPT